METKTCTHGCNIPVETPSTPPACEGPTERGKKVFPCGTTAVDSLDVSSDSRDNKQMAG